MSIKQISVFLENKPGTLDKLMALMAESNIDLRALSLAETKDFGIARMIVDDAFAAVNVLKNADYIASLTPVLAFGVPDEPGGLSKLLTKFTAAGVNIEYMYAFLDVKRVGQACMIFRVSDTEASERALVNAGLKPLTQEDFADL